MYVEQIENGAKEDSYQDGVHPHTDYTFHRHSESKHVVYYRCSDKRCRARLRYNLKTRLIFIKHSHLDPSVHQTPRLNKTISIEELVTMPQLKSRGRRISAPVRLSEAKPESDLGCIENLALPCKRRLYTTISNPPSTEVYLLRFNSKDASLAKIFCEGIVQNGMAVRALYHTEALAYWLLDGRVAKSPQTGVVECEVPGYAYERARELIWSTFGGGLLMSTYRSALEV